MFSLDPNRHLSVRTRESDASPQAYLGAAALLFLAWLAFAWPWLSGTFVIPWDAAAHFAPQVQFMAASFAAGEWPLWNPYAFSGQVQVADPQSMLFSPPMLLLALTTPKPSLWAIDAAVLAMLFVAGLGALLFAYHHRWHWAAGLLAALGFAFGAAMAWRLQHFGQVFSLAYFPFALVFLERALARESAWNGVAAGLFAAFIVLGRDQVGLICVYLLIGRVLWHWLAAAERWSAVRRSAPPLAAGAVTGIALIGLPILMTIHLAGLSNRPSIDYAGAAAGSLHPALFVTAAVPHLFGPAGEMANYWGPPSFTWTGTGLFIAQNMGQLYIGAIPLLILALGFARGDLWRPEIRFLTVALVFATLYALGGYTPAFKLFYTALPGVDLFRRPADAVFVIGGLAALLAGYAAHRLLASPDRDVPSRPAAILAAIVIAPFVMALAFALHFERMPLALPPLLAAIACFAAAGLATGLALWLVPIRPVVAGLALTVPLAADLAWNNGPNGASALPARHFGMLDPARPNETIRALASYVRAATDDRHRPRVELAGLGFHWPNASMTHGLENTLGYNPVRLADYTRATGAGDTAGLPDQRKFTPLFPSYDSPLARMLGLRFVATGVPIEKIDPGLGAGRASRAKLRARTPGGYIYELPEPAPRVTFAAEARQADFDRIIATGRWPRMDPATTVLLADLPAGQNATPRRNPGKPVAPRIVSYTNTEVVVDAASASGGWLVLNDIWHPWWTAAVNGRPAPVLRANVLFRAVRVPPGKVRVRFTFRPIVGVLRARMGGPTSGPMDATPPNR